MTAAVVLALGAGPIIGFTFAATVGSALLVGTVADLLRNRRTR